MRKKTNNISKDIFFLYAEVSSALNFDFEDIRAEIESSIENLDYLADTVNYLYTNKEYLRQAMIDYINYNCKNAESNPIVCATKIFSNYLTDLSYKGLCDKTLCHKINRLLEYLSNTDCYLGYIGKRFGNTFYEYLDEEYFLRTNESRVVGSYTDTESNEHEFGEYICYVFPENNERNGYAVSFLRKGTNVFARIYGVSYDSSNIITFLDNEYETTVTDTNVDTVTKIIAEKINALTKEN